MKYTFEITRRVVNHETVYCVVEADSSEAAMALGDELAESYAMDCPEDYETNYTDCQSWDVMDTRPATPEEIAKDLAENSDD